MIYTELEHQKIAEKQYYDLIVDTPLEIENEEYIIHIGTVTKIYDDMKTDLRAIVVKNSSGV